MEPTPVQLKTVTGDLAPINKQRGVSIQCGDPLCVFCCVDGRGSRSMHPWAGFSADHWWCAGSWQRFAHSPWRAQCTANPSSKPLPTPTTAPPLTCAHQTVDCHDPHLPPSQPPLTHSSPLESSQHQPTGEEQRLAALQDIMSNKSEGLSELQRENLWQVLLEFKDIFALNDNEVGLTHLVQHEIDTGDASC